MDDLRNPPNNEEYDVARTYDEAVAKIDTGLYDTVYLDHDLGDYHEGKERTGYDVVLYIVQRKMDGFPVPTKYEMLTANPVGRNRMLGVIRRYLSEIV